MVGVKYVVEYGDNIPTLSARVEKDGDTHASALIEVDSELNEIALIKGGRIPALYDLSAIDEFRTDEAKVPANTFLIVDTTGATYNRVVEDFRKGYQREVIGIMPVVTTAANALYAQNYINLHGILSDVNKFESLCGEAFIALKAVEPDGKTLVIDNNEMTTSGLLSSDLVMRIACDSYFSDISSISVNLLTTDVDT